MNCCTRLTGYILFATSVFNEKFNIEHIHDIFVGVCLENTVGLCTIVCVWGWPLHTPFLSQSLWSDQYQSENHDCTWKCNLETHESLCVILRDMQTNWLNSAPDFSAKHLSQWKGCPHMMKTWMKWGCKQNLHRENPGNNSPQSTGVGLSLFAGDWRYAFVASEISTLMLGRIPW